MSHEVLAALISLLAVGVIVVPTTTFVGGLFALRNEASSRLRYAFYVLASVGLLVAIWGTSFFKYQPFPKLRVVGVPFPVKAFLLQDRQWMRVAWISHPGFFRGVDFVVTIGIFTAPATVPMLVRLIRRRRSKLRLMAGRCPACNYDMRGSKDTCPECGNPAATR